MKKLFASVAYTYDNFYNNLNTQGQMIFSTILFLIGILCILLFIVYVIKFVQSKINYKNLKNNGLKNENIIETEQIETKKEENDIKSIETEINNIESELKQEITFEEDKNELDSKTEIEDIATAIKEALNDEKPISLTNFEEDQERTAIISIDELMRKAKELELLNEDEENTGINFLEKYNLEPSEVEEAVKNTIKDEKPKEIKAFKVSQVISPIYGVKKEAVDNND